MAPASTDNDRAAWRARREERRVKQRAQNVVRARKMHTTTLVKDFGLIADLLDPRRRNVVEFRHRSWWNEKVYTAFRENGTIFCSTSGPRLPDELVRTADDVYVRFHGTERWYRHDYTKEELAVWTDRIKASGARTVWAYFNNDREGYAISNARELRRQLKR